METTICVAWSLLMLNMEETNCVEEDLTFKHQTMLYRVLEIGKLYLGQPFPFGNPFNVDLVNQSGTLYSGCCCSFTHGGQ